MAFIAGTLLVEMPMIDYENPLMDTHRHDDTHVDGDDENGPNMIETWYW